MLHKHLAVSGGLDCIPASLRFYAENRDFEFQKNLKCFINPPLYDIVLAHFSYVVNPVSRKKSDDKKRTAAEYLTGRSAVY